MKFRATGSEEDEDVTVRIGRPYPGNGGDEYTVDFEIEGPGNHSHASKTYGVDGLQALTLVFAMLNALLDSLRREGQITWEGSIGATRFPTY